MKKIVEYTLSKGKEFLWYYDGEKLTIERTFKNKEKKSEFYNNEIDMIIKYIENNGQVDLSNSVSKVIDGSEKSGIGKFIYDNIRADNAFQQSSSQFVSIMYSIRILNYNNKKRNMNFWIKDLNWKEKIVAFYEKA